MSKKYLLITIVLAIVALTLAACATGGDAEAIADLEAQLAEAQAGGDADRIAELEADLAEAMAADGGDDGAAAGPSGEAAVMASGIFEDMTTTNYWSYYGPDSSVWNQYVLQYSKPALYELSDQRFDFVPFIAAGASGERTQDGDLWSIEVTIREGLTWSDGEAVDAEDAAFTAMTVVGLNLGGNWPAQYGQIIDHVDADGLTVTYFFTDNPGLAQWEYGAAQAPILAEHFWGPILADALDSVGVASLDDIVAPGEDASEDEVAEYETLLADAATALYGAESAGEPAYGPLVFEQWEPGAFAENTSRGDYPDSGRIENMFANGAYQTIFPNGDEYVAYGDASGDTVLELETGPYVPGVLYSIYGSQDAAVLALGEGEIDYFFNPLGLQSGLRDQVNNIDGVTTISNPSNGVRYLAFNIRKDPMSDPAFRQAVATVIDKDFITQTLLQGTAVTVNAMVPEANTFWYNPDVVSWGDGLDRAGRVEAAVALLQDAGYSWTGGEVPIYNEDNQRTEGGDLIMPNGSPVPDIEMLSPSAGYDPMRATAAIWIEQWANDLGIPVTANLVGFNVILDPVFVDADFDWYILGWGLTIYPDYLVDFFASENDTATTGNFNTPGFANDEYDVLAAAFLAATDLEEAQALAYEMQVILATEVPYVTLLTAPVIEAYNVNTINFAYTDVLDGLQNYGATPSTIQVFK